MNSGEILTMKRRMIFLFLMNFIFIQLSIGQHYVSEKRVKKKKISPQIIHYVNEYYKGSSTKYYRLKTDTDSIFYEAKVKSPQGEITLIFDKNSQLVRIDNEVHYFDVPTETRETINTNLSEIFSSYKITYCRDQKLDNERIYELDVSSKKTRYRCRFSVDGTLIDYKKIPQKNLDVIFN